MKYFWIYHGLGLIKIRTTVNTKIKIAPTHYPSNIPNVVDLNRGEQATYCTYNTLEYTSYISPTYPSNKKRLKREVGEGRGRGTY
jgi:hypothetical protein